MRAVRARPDAFHEPVGMAELNVVCDNNVVSILERPNGMWYELTDVTGTRNHAG